MWINIRANKCKGCNALITFGNDIVYYIFLNSFWDYSKIQNTLRVKYTIRCTCRGEMNQDDETRIFYICG